MDTLERINMATGSLENDRDYKVKEEKYAKLTFEFFKDLSEEQIIQFDEIVELIGEMQKDESIAIYNNLRDHTDVPFYIFEEFIRYYKKDKSPVVLSNLKALLGLACSNDRISKERVDFLLEHYT